MRGRRAGIPAARRRGRSIAAAVRRLERRWYGTPCGRIHARVAVAAGGPTVVFVHGVGVSSVNVAPSAVVLGRHCSVYAPDLPGHGDSDRPAEVLDVAGLADALVTWMDAAGLARPALLGNSLGCQVVADLAARYPSRVAAAVLQGPTIDRHARNLPAQLLRWMRNGLRERSTQHDVTFEDWQRIGLLRLALTARHTLRDRIEDKLPAVVAPTLVVRGSRDPIVPQGWAEEVVRLLPRGELAVVDGATHTITHTDPERLAEVVRPFVAAHAA